MRLRPVRKCCFSQDRKRKSLNKHKATKTWGRREEAAQIPRTA